ncbi:hypothetical protein FRC01_010233 [Tulasnella sp. 417]|nr:hypothetical protein FRC01_010233 [Tulasnella sp. 417]
MALSDGTKPAIQRAGSTQFELKSSADVLSPKDLLSMPRPGQGVANPDGDLIIVPVSQYSFETKKTNKTIYISPLDSTVSPIEFPLINGGEAFWLDSRTLAHVVNENVFAVTLDYNATAFASDSSSFVRLPRAPYFVGSFPAGSGPTNFKFTGSKKVHASPDQKDDLQHILVFSANVYPDYDLNTVKEQDEKWENRGNSALVYDELFVRHWDRYVSDKKSRLFSVELNWKNDDLGGTWTLGTDYFKVLEHTEHYTPVEPFGGTDDFDVSREHIVYTAKDPSVSGATHTRQNVYVVPLKGGLVPRELTTGHQGATHSPVFSPDGRWVSWAEMAQDGYESDRAVLVLYDLKTNKRWYLTQDWDRSVQSIEFANDGDDSNPTIFVTASEHAYVKVFSFTIPDFVTSETVSKPKQPKFPTPRAITHSGSVHGLQALHNGKLVFGRSSYAGPNNVYLASGVSKADGHVDFTRVERITQFGVTELKGKSLDHGEQFWFKGAEKGRDVQGWVFKPHGYGSSGDVANDAEGTSKKHDKKEKKWPAVFLIHGGPQGAWEDGWSTRWNPNVFAQQGYFVIAVNPTGSTGFGQDFTDAITKDWGGKPFVDLLHGWKYALKHYPIFDTRNGGYTTDELYFWDHDFGGLPWSKKAKETGEKFNPSQHVDKWSTPQLIVHGGKDYRLAETEGLAAFNALQQRGVPSRLVLFPDENHWVLKPANSYKWHYEVFRWFDQFVGEDAE